MKQRDYTALMAKMAAAYEEHSPASAVLHRKAVQYMVDGGNNALRLIQPFSPRIVSSRGAWLTDEDGHKILDFWQGHFGNVLGHNPEVVTRALSEAFGRRFGLQSGFTDRLQIETAELICRQTGAEKIRFTTSGTLATMYAMMLARVFTGRRLVMKVGGGWHGANPWGLKGVAFQNGFDKMDSFGIPKSLSDEVLITQFNNPEMLADYFKRYGEEVACFILEPLIGIGGLMPATREFVQAARELSQKYGALLILDEVISGFRFRAGNAGALYDVRPDLTTLGKAIGGGMPVAAVAGRADILSLVGREKQAQVKFHGGTYAAHPASMLAAKTMLTYLVENEQRVYPRLAEIGANTRQAVISAFAEEGIEARFAGDRNQALSGTSLHMLLFPYQSDLPLETPEEVRNPSVCDIELSERVLQLALLLEDVYVVHGLGSTTYAHTEAEIDFLREACRRAAKRIKPHL